MGKLKEGRTRDQSCKNVPTVPTSRCYFFWPVLIFGKNTRKQAKTRENRRKTGAFLVLIFWGGKLVGANFYAFCNYVLYLEGLGPITKCRKCKCYYSYLCSLNSLTSWCSLAFDFVKLNFRERSTCWLSWGQKVGPVIISYIQNIQYEISFLDILRTEIKKINMLVALGSKSWTTNY